MKMALTVLGLLLSVSVSAGENFRLPGAGMLSFNGQISYDWKRLNEVVVTLNEAGKNRLQLLRKQDFTCEYKGRETFLCSKLITEGLTLDEELKNVAEAFFNQQEIEFSGRSGDPERLVKGESYEEYSIPQGVRVNDANYPNYRYAILTGSLHKIVFGDPAKGGLVALEDGNYEMLYTVNRTISKNRFEQHAFWGKYR